MNKKTFFTLCLIVLSQNLLWCAPETSKAAENPLKLTVSEQTYVKKLPVLRYSGDPDWMPYESFTADGSHIGVTADFLKILIERSSIKLMKMRSESWAQTVKWMKEGNIDLFSDTDDSVLNKTMVFTKPYLSDRIAIVSADKSAHGLSVDDMHGKRIVLVKDYGYVNAFLKKYPQQSVIWVNSVTEALIAVQNGRADYTIASEYEAASMIFLKFSNLNLAGNTGMVTNLAFGFNPKYKEMVPIFNKAIDTLTDEDRINIKYRWIPSKVETTDYKKLMFVIAFFTFVLTVGYFIYRKQKKELHIRNELQLELTREKNQFETLFKTSADGNNIVINGRFVLCNKAFLDILEMREEDIIGQTPDKISPEYQPDGEKSSVKAQKIIKEALSKGQVRFEWVHFTSSKIPVWCDIVLTKILYNGRVALYAQLRNIDEIKILEETLTNLKVKAEQANKSKSEFLANMSHEIRTPMNAVMGFTELLEKSEGLSSIQKNYVKSIKNGAKNLLAIINDILDLSKIEAGKLQIKKEPFDISVLIEDVESVFAPAIKEKNLKFNIESSPDLPRVLILDDVRLRQIFFNLMSNAIKFTHEGSISFIVKTKNMDKRNHLVDLSFSIADTGIGISPSDQLKIFKEFEQSDKQSTRKYGGTGLGLAISLRLAEGMGGTIILESEQGKGSTFTANFPLTAYTDEDIAFEEENFSKGYRFEKARILSVDDISENLALMRSMLEKHPFEVIEAENGKEALEKLALGDFDLVLSDIRMPVLDGYGLLDGMRMNTQFNKIPVVAVTASLIDSQNDNLLDYGFNAVLPKPYTQEMLEEVISQYIGFTKDKEIESTEPMDKEELHLAGELKALYTEAFGERIKTQSKRNNFSETSALVKDLRVFLEKNPHDGLESLVNGLNKAVNEFDVDQVNAIYKILLKSFQE